MRCTHKGVMPVRFARKDFTPGALRAKTSPICSLTYPDDDSLRDMRSQDVTLVTAVRMDPNDQHEEALVWVGFAFLAHVIRCGFAVVKSADSVLVVLTGMEVNTGWMFKKKRKE